MLVDMDDATREEYFRNFHARAASPYRSLRRLREARDMRARALDDVDTQTTTSIELHRAAYAWLNAEIARRINHTHP